MNQRLLPILLTVLLLSGCVAGKTGTAKDPLADLPYTLDIPYSWQRIDKKTMRGHPMGKMLDIKDMVFDGVYTGAPTNEVRLPFVIMLRFEVRKPTLSEIYAEGDLMVKSLTDGLVKGAKSVVVNRRQFDEARKCDLFDVSMVHEKGVQLDMVLTVNYSQTGALLLFGFAATQDAQGKAEILKIVNSATLAPGYRYE